MTTFNKATELLHKRCDYIEGLISHHEDITGAPESGKHYRHFVLQGLVNVSYYTLLTNSLASSNTMVANGGALTVQDMHLHELGIFETQAKFDNHLVSLQALRDYGLDISNYPISVPLSQTFRQGVLYRPIREAYQATFSRVGGHLKEQHLTAHYKGRELIPADASASWADQADNLIYQAQSQPLKSLLDAQHIVAPEGSAGVLSLRRAGFPAEQFQHQRDGHNILPKAIHRSLDDDLVRTLDDSPTTSIVRHCPSIVMVTIECPDNLDELMSGESNEDIQLTYYLKQIMVPHWIGHANIFDHTNCAEGDGSKTLDQSRLYDPSLVSYHANVITSAAVADFSNTNNNAYGDLLLYTPSDDSLSRTEIPSLSSARSFEQTPLEPQKIELYGNVSSVVENAQYHYGGFSGSTIFRDNPVEWGQNRDSGYVEVRFKTSEKHVVASLTIGNGGPSRKWGKTVKLYVKSPDHSNGTGTSNWSLHEKIDYVPTREAQTLLLTTPTSETNLFKVELSNSDEVSYVSVQHIGLEAFRL